MTTAEYLDRLLLCYSGSFDIYQPYVINGKEYPAYGYFFSCVEKYLLVREINMWSTRSYEHILFIETDSVDESVLTEAEGIIRDYMEPVLVRKNEKYPEPNHMYSYLNVVIISKNPVSSEAAKRIRRFKFDKGYKFNIRGYSLGTLMCVSMDDRKYISNRHGSVKEKMFLKVFEDVDQGKEGFAQVMAEKGLTPYKQ